MNKNIKMLRQNRRLVNKVSGSALFPQLYWLEPSSSTFIPSVYYMVYLMRGLWKLPNSNHFKLDNRHHHINQWMLCLCDLQKCCKVVYNKQHFDSVNYLWISCLGYLRRRSECIKEMTLWTHGIGEFYFISGITIQCTINEPLILYMYVVAPPST